MAIAVVAGALANKPRNGGAAWTRLGWVLGLEALGFEVHFVERISPDACVDEEGTAAPLETSVNRAFFDDVTTRFGLSGRAWLGLADDPSSLPAGLLGAAEILVNVTGHLRLADLASRPRRTVYVDLDPGYTQIWMEQGVLEVEPHDRYMTVGQRIGTEGCGVPTGGLEWTPVLPPVPLEHWPLVESASAPRFTTVGAWRGPYGSVEYRGETYGQKAHRFREILELPRQAPYEFELALEIHEGDEADRRALEEHGWHVVEASLVAADPEAFRTYVQGSGAELSAAQGVYSGLRTGWFSDRTARYLASGLPAVVEDTGLPIELSEGIGVLPFFDLDDAVRATAHATEDHPALAARARAFAERHLDARVVVGGVLEAVGASP